MKKFLQFKVAPARYAHAHGAGDDYGVTDGPDWRSIDWSEHLHRTQILGSEVNYADIGDQGDHRPIVFIHGLGGQWQNWLENVPRFSEARRVVALDLPGFGLSEMPSEKITIEFYGRVVAELCEQLGLAPAVLVGNSMGGFVAAEVAIKRPDIAERLMLLASAGVSQVDVAKRPTMAAAKAVGLLTTSNLARLRVAATRPKVRHWTLALVARHPSRISPELAFEGMMKGTNKPGFDDALRACLDYDFRDRLPKIGCPTIVVWGEKDMIIPVEDAQRFTDLIPGARKITFKDTGHVPMIERPATFNGVLQEFLEHQVSEGELEEDSTTETAA